METLQALGGFALIIGLFVAYAMERRAKRRSENAAANLVEHVTNVDVAPPPPPVVASAPAAAAPDQPASDTVAGAASAPASVSYGSPNWGAPIFFTALLLGAATHRGSWWGILWQVLYLAFIVVAAYSTFSPKELRDEQKRRPGTTRRDVYLRIGVPYLVIPLIAWVLTIPMGYGGAAIIPAIPWILLIALGAVMSLGRSGA